MEACINEECILCGFCADICPGIFSLGDEFARVIVTDIPAEHQDCCVEAADNCPTDAIKILD